WRPYHHISVFIRYKTLANSLHNLKERGKSGERSPFLWNPRGWCKCNGLWQWHW
ncbi:hypothetical protein Goklo_024841, partial [Gossypium klotzschianum]|nr:hypothetical protein [Gossypium klotzschianum]